MIQKIKCEELSSYVDEKKHYIEAKEDTKFFSHLIFRDLSLDMNKKVLFNGLEVDEFDFRDCNAQEEQIFEKVVFYECEIHNLEIFSIVDIDIAFEKCTIKNFVMKNQIGRRAYLATYSPIYINGGEIENLYIKNCRIGTRFFINNQTDENSQKISIKTCYIRSTIFEENFKLHNAVIDSLSIEDSDFEKNAAFFMSEFKKGIMLKNEKEKTDDGAICFRAINFNNLALFGDTVFRKKLIFKYVTFDGFSHFRNANFYEGLDLDYSNIQLEMNFYNTKGLESKRSKKYTSQETYRIIKYNFEKIGNKIEANKYHALELQQRKKSVSKRKFKSFSDMRDWIVFWFHNITSNNSTNWVLSLGWIFIVSYFTYLAVGFFVCNKTQCSDEFLDVFKYMSLVNFGACIKENPLIFILNKVSLSYLYYQFILSVKKDTRK